MRAYEILGWLEGRKIRRKAWDEGGYVSFNYSSGVWLNHKNEEPINFSLPRQFFEYDDWLTYEEPKERIPVLKECRSYDENRYVKLGDIVIYHEKNFLISNEKASIQKHPAVVTHVWSSGSTCDLLCFDAEGSGSVFTKKMVEISFKKINDDGLVLTGWWEWP